jgi:hypothetical protein
MKILDSLFGSASNYILFLLIVSVTIFFSFRMIFTPDTPDNVITWGVRKLPSLQYKDLNGAIVSTKYSIPINRDSTTSPTLLYYFNPRKEDQVQIVRNFIDNLQQARAVRLFLVATSKGTALNNFYSHFPRNPNFHLVYDYLRTRNQTFFFRKKLPFVAIYGDDSRVLAIETGSITKQRLDTLLAVPVSNDSVSSPITQKKLTHKKNLESF